MGLIGALQVESYCHAGARQFGFMLRGLKQMGPKLEALNIPFFVVKGDPTKTIPKLVKDTKAALLVTDFATLRDGRRWRDTVSPRSLPWFCFPGGSCSPSPLHMLLF